MSRIQSVITLGSFDGVHLGHQAILMEVVRQAKSGDYRPSALVFDHPPKLVQAGVTERLLLTTFAEKKELLQKMGIGSIDVLTFNRQTAALTAEAFFQKIIVQKHRATAMVVGPRMAFGRGRRGTLAVLRQLGRASGVQIHVVPMIGTRLRGVSSSAIREMLLAGDTQKAARALGRPYSLSGRVIPGTQRGRLLGYPTLNVSVDAGKVLPPGVFRVRVEGLGKTHEGVCNVGTRPTFAGGEKDLSVEVHVLSRRLKPAYGRRVKIAFFERLRSEKRFASPKALILQIQKDVTRAKRFSYNSGD